MAMPPPPMIPPSAVSLFAISIDSLLNNALAAVFSSCWTIPIIGMKLDIAQMVFPIRERTNDCVVDSVSRAVEAISARPSV